MLSKGKINMILGLCLTSIVSVGFSSWVISQDSNPIDIHGNIEVDNVINSKEYVELNKETLSVFTYTNNGFKTESGVSENGQISAEYTIKIGACREYFQKAKFNEFNIELTLSYCNEFTSSINLFYDAENEHTLTHQLTEISNATKQETTIHDYKYVISIPIIDDGAANEIKFKITYNFWIKQDYFIENIVTMFNDENFNFAINTKLTLN